MLQTGEVILVWRLAVILQAHCLSGRKNAAALFKVGYLYCTAGSDVFGDEFCPPDRTRARKWDEAGLQT